VISGKSSEENNERVRYFSKRVMILHIRRAILAGVIALILAGVILVIVHNYRNRCFTDYEVIGEESWHVTQNQTVLAYGSDFLCYSADGIRCSNARGVDLWSASYLMQNPMVDVCGDYVAAADRKGRTIYMYDKNGPLGEIDTSSPIERIAVSAGGVVAVVLDDSTTTPVCLYYYDGRQIASFRTTMEKSGYPVCVAISDNSRLVGISYLRVDSGTLISSVAFYNFGEVGKNETDNLVSSNDFQGELVPYVSFLNNEVSFSVSDKRITLYEGGQIPKNLISDMLPGEVRSVIRGRNHIGLVYYDDSGESRYLMQLYNRKGQHDGQVRFDVEYSDIVITENRVLVYNATSCAIYTMDGHLKYKGDFDTPVRLMMPTSSTSRYLLVTDDLIRTIQLK